MASKDLQIVRTRSVRLAEPSAVISAAETASEVNPMSLMLDALRRQWFLILLATATAGGAAWYVATEFHSESATGQLVLVAQKLPLGTGDVYSPPNPNGAATLIRSPMLIQDIVDKHGFETRAELLGRLRVSPSMESSTISIELQLDEKLRVADVLNDIGTQFLTSMNSRRNDDLIRDENVLTEQERDARKGVVEKEVELVKLQHEAVRNRDSTSQKTAELQKLINRLSQAEQGLEQASLRRDHLLLEQSVLMDEMRDLERKAAYAVLAGRRRQIEGLQQGVRRNSRNDNQKGELLAKLDSLESQVVPFHEAWQDRHQSTDGGNLGPPVDARESLEAPPKLGFQPASAADDLSSPAAKPSSDAVTASVAAAVTEAVQQPAGASELAVVSPADSTAATWTEYWLERVSAVGRDVFGELDAATIGIVRSAESQLSGIVRTNRNIQLQLYSNRIDFERQQEKIAAAKNDIELFEEPQPAIVSTHERELTRELDARVAHHVSLRKRLDAIASLKACTIPDYVIASRASTNGLETKSNFNKLFVFSFFGAEVLLLSPVLLVELLRKRQTPLAVLSRRWNLPVLGLQTAQLPARGPALEHSSTPDHDVRLMALRIQQSLFQPKGRVVLFSGLDHDESPMALIRSLSQCFVRREETVLVIQAFVPETGGLKSERRSSREEAPVRPGVSDFLSGEYNEVSSLVSGTDTVGINFLPMGSTAAGPEAMASSRMTALIDQCRDMYSMILVVGPSTLHPADLQMLAARADGIVFTVNSRSLKGPFGQEVISDLLELGAPILGFAEQPALHRSVRAVEEWTRELVVTTGTVSA